MHIYKVLKEEDSVSRNREKITLNYIINFRLSNHRP